MRWLQLNTEQFRFWNALIEYIEKDSFDLITMQEVGYWRYSSFDNTLFDPVERLALLWYHVAFMPQFILQDEVSKRWNLIASKYPIIKSGSEYIDWTQSLSIQTIEQLWLDLDVSLYENRKRKRNLERAIPFGVCYGIFDVWWSQVAVVTIHLRATPKCREDEHMKECMSFVLETIKTLWYDKVILTWDCNIQKDADCIKDILLQWFEHVNITHHTTLHPTIHPGFKNDIPPEWYMVDHVFLRWIQLQSYSIPTVDISDHLPIIYEYKVE